MSVVGQPPGSDDGRLERNLIMKNQKELKEKYMEVIKKEVWQDERMQEFARKECAYVVQLANGNIISLDKPKIQKNFCYGMGMYATYTQEEFERAEGLAEKARTDVNYFIQKNMEQVTNKIEYLKECLEGERECYTFTNYIGQPDKSILKGYNTVRICDNPEYYPGRWLNCKDLKKLDSKDIDAIIEGLEEVGKKFMKRLNTYLKKYGLEKLNVWTYCRD